MKANHYYVRRILHCFTVMNLLPIDVSGVLNVTSEMTCLAMAFIDTAYVRHPFNHEGNPISTTAKEYTSLLTCVSMCLLNNERSNSPVCWKMIKTWSILEIFFFIAVRMDICDKHTVNSWKWSYEYRSNLRVRSSNGLWWGGSGGESRGGRYHLQHNLIPYIFA